MPGQITSPEAMEKQEQHYERMRAIAEQNSLKLEKGNHPKCLPRTSTPG